MAGRSQGRVERTLTHVGSASLLALMVIVFVDVTGRSLFNHPLPWGTELLEVLLATMVFVLYPVLALRGEHILVDLVPVPRSLRSAQRVLAGTVGALLFAVIAYCCARQALRSASYGDASAILGIPTAWVLWGMALFSALSALVFTGHALGVYRRFASSHAPAREGAPALHGS